MSFDKYCRRLIWAVRADLLARTSFGKVDTLPSTSGRVAGQGWLPSICTSTSETGSSLKANDLRIVDEILQSTTRFIANEKAYSDPWTRGKIDNLALMLKSCLAAEGKVGLMMNVARKNLETVLGILPALQTPTISSLSDPDWVDVNTILDESLVRTMIPQLKSAGARGIVEYGINKIIE